jgi:hypothetical protein
VNLKTQWTIAAALLWLVIPANATVGAPVSLNLGSSDIVAPGKPANVTARIEAAEDIEIAQFSVLSSRDWRIQDGTSNYTGTLKARQVLELRFTAVPLTDRPEPLSAQLAVRGYPAHVTSLDPSRMGGATPEITIVRIEPRKSAAFEDHPVLKSKTGERSAFITVTVTGTFFYLDTSRGLPGVRRPVRKAKVKVYDRDQGILRDDSCGTGSTDSNGFFSVTGSCGDVGSGPDLYIGIELNNDVVDVRPEGLTARAYAFYGQVNKDHAGSSLPLGDIEITSNKDAFQAHNLVMRAHDFMVTEGETLPKATLRWPSTKSTFYTQGLRILHIEDRKPFLDELAVYHEYGHHVLTVRSESPIAFYDNGHCDTPDPGHCVNQPENGVISWTEGWPNFFADFLFKRHGTEDSYGTASRDLESFIHAFPGQEDKIEGVIAAILVDLTDTTNDDQAPTGDGRRDALGLAFTFSWDVIRNFNPAGGGIFHNHPTSIHEFYDGMASRQPTLINRVAEIYREHNIVKPQPDLVVSALLGPSQNLSPGATFSVSSTIRNDGMERANNSSTVRFELVSGTSNTLLGARQVGAEFAAGGSSVASTTLSIPTGTAAGIHTLRACADASANVPEADESNNCRTVSVSVVQ